MSVKQLPVPSPVLTSEINSKDKNLWTTDDVTGGNRRLSGYEVVAFNEGAKTVTIDPGFFIHNGIAVQDTLQNNLNIDPSLYSGGFLLGTVDDPVILYAETPDNVTASGHTFDFARDSSLRGGPPPVTPYAVAPIAIYEGTSWRPAESIAVGGVLDLALQNKSFIGDVPLLQLALTQGFGSSFDNISILSDRVQFSALSFLAGSVQYEKELEEVIFEEARNLDAADSILLRAGTPYFLYGGSDGEVKWSSVPPSLGTRSAWVPGDEAFSLPGSIVITAANANLKVTVNGSSTSLTGVIPNGTYTVRELANKIMDDTIWSGGRAPIRVFDIGSPGDPDVRYLCAYTAGKSGINQTLKFETVIDNVYATIGWDSFVSVERAGSGEGFIASIINDGVLSLLPAQIGKQTLFEGRAAGSSTSGVLIGDFDDSTVFPQTIDLADLVPPGSKFVKILVNGSIAMSFSVTGRESQADLSITSGEPQQVWDGDLPVGRERQIIVSASVPAAEIIRFYLRGYQS